MEKTSQHGVGMVAVVAPEDTDRALAILDPRGTSVAGHRARWLGKNGLRASSWASTHLPRRRVSGSAPPFVPSAQDLLGEPVH